MQPWRALGLRVCLIVSVLVLSTKSENSLGPVRHDPTDAIKIQGLRAARDLGIETLQKQRVTAEHRRAEMLRVESVREQKLWAKWLVAQQVHPHQRFQADMHMRGAFMGESLRGGGEEVVDIHDQDAPVDRKLTVVEQGVRDMQHEMVEVECKNNMLFRGILHTADEAFNVVLKPPIEVWNTDTNTLVDEETSVPYPSFPLASV
mmetsp:Transcript_39354/g.61346  ORF Transcript_39354/g.61346 Transcript_39354/m.61346 type:complete len:204 (-) Transcript_39354:606-1217(-)